MRRFHNAIIGLDTSYLLSLSLGDARAIKAIEKFAAEECRFLVSETVIAELATLAHSRKEDRQDIGSKTLRSIGQSGFLVHKVPEAQRGIIDSVVKRLKEKIHQRADRAALTLIVEYAMLGASIILSFDRDLQRITNEPTVVAFLTQMDLVPVRVSNGEVLWNSQSV